MQESHATDGCKESDDHHAIIAAKFRRKIG